MVLPECTPPCESPEMDIQYCHLQRAREGLTGCVISFLLFLVYSSFHPSSSDQPPTSLDVGELWLGWVERDALWEPESDFISTWSRRGDWEKGLDSKPRTSWQDVAFQEVKRWISSFVSFLIIFWRRVVPDMEVGGQTSKKVLLSLRIGSAHTSCEVLVKWCRASFIQGPVAEWTKDRDNNKRRHLSINKHRCAFSTWRISVTWIYGALDKKQS